MFFDCKFSESNLTIFSNFVYLSKVTFRFLLCYSIQCTLLYKKCSFHLFTIAPSCSSLPSFLLYKKTSPTQKGERCFWRRRGDSLFAHRARHARVGDQQSTGLLIFRKLRFLPPVRVSTQQTKKHPLHFLLWIAKDVMVGVKRLELPTSCSQSKRATNCATPRYVLILQNITRY